MTDPAPSSVTGSSAGPTGFFNSRAGQVAKGALRGAGALAGAYFALDSALAGQPFLAGAGMFVYVCAVDRHFMLKRPVDFSRFFVPAGFASAIAAVAFAMAGALKSGDQLKLRPELPNQNVTVTARDYYCGYQKTGERPVSRNGQEYKVTCGPAEERATSLAQFARAVVRSFNPQ